ncbi:MAG: hypothetical protein RR448_01285 [Niameybacter sp.]
MNLFTPEQLEHSDIDPHFRPSSRKVEPPNPKISSDTLHILLLIIFLFDKNGKNK